MLSEQLLLAELLLSELLFSDLPLLLLYSLLMLLTQSLHVHGLVEAVGVLGAVAPVAVALELMLLMLPMAWMVSA